MEGQLSSNMKIVVVGIGAVGFFLCKYFIENTDFKIKCVDKSIRNLRRLKQFTTSTRISLHRLGLNNSSSLEKLIKDADLLINAATPSINKKLLEIALKNSVNYQDLASELEDFINPEQLQFSENFKQKGLVALINTGISPGLTNLIAGEIASRFEAIETIKIRVFEDQRPPGTIWSWSPKLLLSDVLSPPVVYKKGKYISSEPFGEPEYYDYPEPIGRRKAYLVYADEVSTLPKFIKVKNVNLKAAGSDIEFLMALYNMGLLSNTPLKINGVMVSPYEVLSKIVKRVASIREIIQKVKEGLLEEATFGIVVEVIGKKDGINKKIRGHIVFPSIKELIKIAPGSTHVSYPTALVAGIMAKFIKKIQTVQQGVFPPEALHKSIRKRVLSELKKEGFNVVFEEIIKKRLIQK
ncbi:MAG: saccharopine dehydrogenase NADP-binding domain-containing protein [Thermodesulfovibrio sp.]|nr:saccharopine dehydrogenase NADP-binding domain-containing protein [Thermodesulfovibrio sp.]MDW7972098.1 saccharopine dehydrogenase NADP-binding domain-containing protein [Thermodesulfovibrio sp.]